MSSSGCLARKNGSRCDDVVVSKGRCAFHLQESNDRQNHWSNITNNLASFVPDLNKAIKEVVEEEQKVSSKMDVPISNETEVGVKDIKMTTEMTTPSSPKSINSDEYNMCEICDDKVATHWRHDCGCKGLCDDCVVKHDKECEDYKLDLWLEELNKFDELHKIKYARWSIHEWEGQKWTIEKFNEKHPFQQCNKIVMRRYEENTFSRIDKNKHTTWLDIYKLCDKRITKYRGDHRFIEQFEVRGKTLLLGTGS